MNTTKMKWIRSRIVVNPLNGIKYSILLYKERNSDYYVISAFGIIINRSKNLKKIKLRFSQLIRDKYIRPSKFRI